MRRGAVAYNVFVSHGKKGKRRASKWFVMTLKTVKPNRVPKIQALAQRLDLTDPLRL